MLKLTLARLALASSLAAPLAACNDAPHIVAVPTPSTDLARPGQMTVTGTATLDVAPDCADLTMTISADGLRPGLATAAVQAKQEQLVAALRKLGVEPEDLKLSTLTLNPIYANTPDGWSELKVATYRAQITVTATTKRFDQIGPIMDAGAQAGASAMSSQFRRSDLAALKKQVRDLALAAAKDKAAQTAKALGIDLGRIVSVAEQPGGYMWSGGYFPNVAQTRMETNPAAPTVLGGATQSLTLDITIGYELAKS